MRSSQSSEMSVSPYFPKFLREPRMYLNQCSQKSTWYQSRSMLTGLQNHWHRRSSARDEVDMHWWW